MKAFFALLIGTLLFGCAAQERPELSVVQTTTTASPSTAGTISTTTTSTTSTSESTTTIITQPSTTIQVETTETAPTVRPITTIPPITTIQSAMMGMVNQTRVAKGLPVLITDSRLVSEAVNWSQHLATTQSLVHSDISRLLPYWRIVGENIGQGPTQIAIYNALLASPDHLANIINPAYQYGGMGVTMDKIGQLWIVQLFSGD